MLSRNPEPKLKYSKNRISVTSHFGTLCSCFLLCSDGSDPVLLLGSKSTNIYNAVFTFSSVNQAVCAKRYERPVMEDRRTEVLCAGLLIKSPANSERKAAFARFWKLRWCVLQRITYIGSRNEGSKLAFCYYKSEEEFRNEKLPCGIHL